MTSMCRGNGVLDYANGDVYTGDIVNLLPNGQGRMVYDWGASYEGGRIDGQWSGSGIVTWDSGYRFEGAMTSTGNGAGIFYDLNLSSSWACNLVNWVPYPA